jgi:hypothetical protein
LLCATTWGRALSVGSDLVMMIGFQKKRRMKTGEASFQLIVLAQVVVNEWHSSCEVSSIRQ